KKNDFVVQEIFDKIFDKIKDESPNKWNNMKLLSIISLNLSRLHSNLAAKYISYTSIILDPSCSSIKISSDISLNAYSKNISIVKPNYFKGLQILFSSVVNSVFQEVNSVSNKIFHLKIGE